MSLWSALTGRGSRASRTAILQQPAGRRLRDFDDGQAPNPFREHSIGPLGVLFCAALVAVIVLILDFKVIPPLQRTESIAAADVASRLDYKYYDPQVLERLRNDAANEAPRVYNEDPQWADKVLADLTELIRTVEASRSLAEARDRTQQFKTDQQLVEELYKYHIDVGERRKVLSSVLLGRIRLSLQALSDNGIVSEEDYSREANKPGTRDILRVSPSGGKARGEPVLAIVPINRLRSDERARNDFAGASWRESLPLELYRQLNGHLRSRLTPNLSIDSAASEQRRELARQAVGNTDVKVKRGDLILNRGREILESDIDKLYAENRAFKRAQPFAVRALHIAGLVAVSASVLLIGVLFALRTHREIFRRGRALVMLGLALVALLALHRALLLNGLSPAITPFILLGMTASLAFGQGIALSTLLAAFVLTTVSSIRWEASPVEGGIPFLNLALMAGALAAALPAPQLRARIDLLKYGLLGGFVQFVFTFAMACLGLDWAALQATVVSGGVSSVTLSELSTRAGYPTLLDAGLALVNGPVCGLLMLGSQPLLETLFGMLTNIRLLELAQTDQPALRLIQDKAPGTFTHTLAVRSLAEPAAEAIGANRLLVGTGVLYHDIGKVLKPEYFVENNKDAEALHRRVRPSVSALLITAHVKDGIELAREFGLPQQIIDFIPEHHGTTLVSYFYHSAMKQAEAAGSDPGETASVVQEAFFRYPGPKPQSRETAIVMLADTVDAATRTLDDPSPARLATFVHELTMQKMVDGQFDECDLSFADLRLIEEAFVRVLITRFHSRVRYPGQDEKERDNPSGTKILTPGGTPVDPASLGRDSSRRTEAVESTAPLASPADKPAGKS